MTETLAEIKTKVKWLLIRKDEAEKIINWIEHPTVLINDEQVLNMRGRNEALDALSKASVVNGWKLPKEPSITDKLLMELSE